MRRQIHFNCFILPGLLSLNSHRVHGLDGNLGLSPDSLRDLSQLYMVGRVRNGCSSGPWANGTFQELLRNRSCEEDKTYTEQVVEGSKF